MARFITGFFSFFFLVIAAAALGFVVFDDRFKSAGTLGAETSIVLPRGAGVQSIAAQLRDAGVISGAFWFRLGFYVYGRDQTLKAGEYVIPAHSSPYQVMQKMIAGETVVRRLTIPEGLTSAQVTALVNSAEGLTGTIETIPAEGTLLPETYHYSWGDGRAEIVARMEAAFGRALASLWDGRADDHPLVSKSEVVVLASIVEKETSVPEERAHIAGVFFNRLGRGMRLQSDPTVIYALTNGLGPLDRPLTQADLKVASPFNTYQVTGLPPGPIANPGRDALAAVIAPLVTKDLYFVANGQGGHAFAETLRGHNRNVAAWRKAKKQARARQNASPGGAVEPGAARTAAGQDGTPGTDAEVVVEP